MIVLGARICLIPRTPCEIRGEMLRILRERRIKFPRRVPTCGSVFKASQALLDAVGPPGKAIEQLGLKGLCWGGLQTSPTHANFFLNRGGAAAADALGLIAHVREQVKSHYGVEMETEVVFVDTSGRVATVSAFLDCRTSVTSTSQGQSA